jgi:hypothetical protein
MFLTKCLFGQSRLELFKKFRYGRLVIVLCPTKNPVGREIRTFTDVRLSLTPCE